MEAPTGASEKTSAAAPYGAGMEAKRGGDQIVVNVPVSIPVTSLDPKQAANVIMEQMPLILAQFRKDVERGGRTAMTVGRRKGGMRA
jgi:hypothetical protein